MHSDEQKPFDDEAQHSEGQNESSPQEETPQEPIEDQEPVADPEADAPPKKKKKRGFIWIVLLLIIVVGGWYGYKFISPQSSGPRINPLNLVPEDAFFIIETDEPYSVWSKLGKTRMWKTLAKDEEWKEYGEQLNDIEQTLSGFDQVLDVLSSRTIYASGHLYRQGDYDYLFILDMEGMGVLRKWMTTQQNMTKRTFGDKTIYEQFDPDTKETLYFTYVDNFFVGSYTHTLVEASIEGFEEAALSRSFDFIQVRKQAIGEGVVRLYLNYKTLYPYLESILGEEYTQIMKDNLPLFHSGFYFDVEESSLFLEGYSNYNDSLATYLKIFEEAGTGGMDIAKVLPARTSIYFSVGFDSFSKFYKALDNQLREDPEYGEDYALYTKRTEKFLDISLEDDFAGWVDDELAVIQLESEGTSEPEIALVFKAKSSSLANEKMEFLSRQIKRKTPVKFKLITYKGYPINFMSVKGLFNLVLGNLFNYFDRPYYTIIDEYVVFSNQPQVLRRFINDYISENTLANVDGYKDFIDQLGEKHCASLYLQLPLLENTKGGMMDDETAQLLREKRAIISDFPQLGFSMYPSKNMYQTRALVSIDNMELPDPTDYAVPFVGDTINYDSLWKIDPGEQIEITALDVEIDDFGAKKQTEDYEDGTQKYEVEIKDGMKHGSYYEYHPTGELKVKGKYKEDLMEGTWRYYDEQGNLVKKERYKRGELQ